MGDTHSQPEKQLSKTDPSPSGGAPQAQPGSAFAQSVTQNRAFALLLAGLYTAFILTAAFLVGSLLSNRARELAQVDRQPILPLDVRAPQIAAPDTGPLPAGEPVIGQATPAQSAPALADLPQKQINILLLGSDERARDNEPPRTDTMLLLTLDLEHRTAGMISLPRDLWVPIPGYDLTTKINTAYVLGEKRGYPGGGAQLAKDTVSSFIGRPVQYYVQVNFNGFVRFIDLIGGVKVDVSETIHDEQYPTANYGYQTFHLDAGPQHLDGETALKYVRTRNADSDYGRAARQQQLIQAVMDKVTTAGMIPMLVSRAPQLMNAMRTSFRTDMPVPTAIDIARYVHSNSFVAVRQVVLDDRYGTESWSEDGAWILLPDRQRIRPMLSEFFDIPPEAISDQSLPASGGAVVSVIASQATDPNPASAAPIQSIAQARLEILNGTGYPGIAARVRTELQAQGWTVVAIGDADRSDYRRTLLVNYSLDESLAQEIGPQLRLQSALPTLPGLIISDSVDLRIVVGQDYVKNVLGTNP